MSLREFFNAYQGLVDLEKGAWERARFVASSIVYVMVPKKEHHKLDAAFAMPWDSSEDVRGRGLEALKALDFEAEEKATTRIARKFKELENGTQ
jgi:hypothetical protein